jgi:hypothetical protein
LTRPMSNSLSKAARRKPTSKSSRPFCSNWPRSAGKGKAPPVRWRSCSSNG